MTSKYHDGRNSPDDPAPKRQSKHQGGPNPPGYIPPKRKNKRTLQGYLEQPLYTAMQEIAARMKITIGDALHLACREFAKRYSNQYVDIPAAYDPPRTRMLIKQDLVNGDDPGDVQVYTVQAERESARVPKKLNSKHLGPGHPNSVRKLAKAKAG